MSEKTFSLGVNRKILAFFNNFGVSFYICIVRNEFISIALVKRGIQITFFIFFHQNIFCGYSLEAPQ